MGFDIDGARAAGYSNSEIADYLSTQRNFDAAGARKAGYSDDEIIQHLTGEPGLASQAALGTVDALGMGSGQTVNTVGQVLGATGPGTAGTLVNAAGSITRAAGGLAGALSANPEYSVGAAPQTDEQIAQTSQQVQQATDQAVAQHITPVANRLLEQGRQQVALSIAQNPNSPESLRYRAGQALQDVGAEAQQHYSREMEQDAPAMVRQGQAIQDANGFVGTLAASAKNPLGVLSTVAQSAPDMIVGAGLSKAAAGALLRSTAVREAAAAAGEQAFQDTLLRAASNPQTLANATNLAQAARQQAVQGYLQSTAERAAAGVGLGTESLQSGGANAAQVRQFVDEQTPEQLAQVPRYQDLLKTHTPADAKEILADELANQSAGSAAIWTALAGKASGAADAWGHTVAGSPVTARQFVGGVAKEGLEEAMQNPGEDYAKYLAQSQVDPSQTFDLGGSIAQGVVGGVTQGGALHGGGHLVSHAMGELTPSVTLAGRPITAYTTDQLQGYAQSGVLTGDVQAKVDAELQRRSAAAQPEQGADAAQGVPAAAAPIEPAQAGGEDQLDTAIQRFAQDAGIAEDAGPGGAAPGADAGRGGGDRGVHRDDGAGGVQASAAAPAGAGEQAAPAAPAAGELAAPVAAPATPLDEQAHAAATSPNNDLAEPTEAQKQAGNYAKGHVRLAGMDLSIENPQGSVRRGVDRDGTPWENTLQSHYGYIKGTIGNDKDHVDAFVKPGTPADYSGPVFVVDQVHPDSGKFDEHKVVIGAASKEEAEQIYRANYAQDWQGLAGIHEMPMQAFKSWVYDGEKKKPLGALPAPAKSEEDRLADEQRGKAWSDMSPEAQAAWDKRNGIPPGRREEVAAQLAEMERKTAEDKAAHIKAYGEKARQAIEGGLGRPSADTVSKRQRLFAVAQRLGIPVHEGGSGFHAGGGYVAIPAEDQETAGAVTPEHVFAHELGHAVMQRRGLNFAGFPTREMLKWIDNWPEWIEASKRFRPAIHQSEDKRVKAHAKKPNEIVADAIGSVLLGESPESLVVDRVAGLTRRDLGLDESTSPSDHGVAFSRSPDSPEVARVSDLAQSVSSAWANGPEVVTVQSMQDPTVPERLRSLDAEQKSQGAAGEPEGFFHDGKVYLIASELHSPDDVVRVLMHEALGHYGLRGVFGETLKPILDQLARLRSDLVEAKATQYGLDITNERQRRAAAEEVLAELAQSRPKSSYVQRAIAAIRGWLRDNVPGLADLKLTDAEIVSRFIEPARGFVERGAGARSETAAEPALSRSPAPPAPNGHLNAEVPGESRAQAARRVVQDQHIRMRQLREWAQANGAQLSPASDAYGAEERMHGRMATRIEDFREKTVKPLIEEAQKAGFTVEQVAQFLHAQHAAERNQQIAKINPQMPDGGSGMSTADAQKILAAAPPGLEKIANKFQAITARSRDILLRSGIISQEMADAWDSTYEHYVPLKGGDEDEAAMRSGVGKGLSVNGKTKRALGHTAREEAIIENILRDHERAIMLAEKNRVGQAMMLWLAEMNDPRIGTIDQPVKRATLVNKPQYEVRLGNAAINTFDTEAEARAWISRQVAAKAPQAKQMKVAKAIADQTVQYMARPMLEDHEAQAYVRGHAVRMQLNDPLLAQSYKRLNTEQMGKLLAASRQINNYLSRAYTGYNPAFILRNLIRDFGSGAIKITGNYGAGTTAKAIARYPKALSSLLRYSYSGKSTPAIDAYRANGGSTGAAYLSDLERIGTDLQHDYERYQGAIALMRQGRRGAAARVAAGKLIGGLTGVIEHVNAATENAMRLAVFEQIREETGSIEEAASAAKNSTVNFNRKGEMGGVLGALYLFFNPNVQDTASVVETLARGKNRNQARALVAAMAGIGYALVALQFGGSDDDYERWKKIPDSVRDKNLLIRTGPDKYVTIPVPFGFGFFHTLGNTLFAAQKGEDVNQLSVGMASNFLDHFSPLGNPLQNAKSWNKIDPRSWLHLIPGAPGTGELGRDAVSTLINQSTLGGDIVPDSKFDEERPDFLRMYRATKGTVYDKTARGLSDLTGGTATSPGAIDVSPETLKFWTSAITGGTGTFLSDMLHLTMLQAAKIGTPADQVGNLSPEQNEIPIWRDYVREERVQDARRAYWDAVSEAKAAMLDFKRAVKAGDDEGAARVQDKDGELLPLVSLSNSMSKMVKYQRDRVDEINADQTTSLAFKRGAVRQLEKEEAAIYDEFLHEVTRAKNNQRALSAAGGGK